MTTDISGFDDASDVAIQPDGKIVAVGGTSIADFAAVRYNADGTLDTGFGSGGVVTTDFGGQDRAYAVALSGDKIIVAGRGNEDFALARYNADGSLDNTFSGDGKETTDISSFDDASDVAIQPDGKIVAAGVGNQNFALARYNPDGTPDTGFGNNGTMTTDFGGTEAGEDLALQADGKIVVVGSWSMFDPEDPMNRRSGFALARYNPDGALDNAFGDQGKVVTELSQSGGDLGLAVALQADGKIVVSGSAGGSFALARYFGNNLAPVSNNDPYSVREDEPLTAGTPGVLANDTDAEGAPLTARLVTGPENAASFSLNPDGSFSYTPRSDFNGTDAFTYKANDGTTDSGVATVVISVRAANDAPSANDDTERTEKDTPVRINALGNDFDIDGDRIVVTGASDPAGGATTVNPDNTITYTPDEGYLSQPGSPDTFTYTVEDPSGVRDTAAVTVEVGDTGTPSVVSVSPMNARNTVARGANVKVTFSEKMDPNTLDETTFTLVRDGANGPVAATVTLDASGKKAVLDPAAPLTPGATYVATVRGGPGGAADPSGNALAGDQVWFFGVNSAPSISGLSPRPGTGTPHRTPRIRATVTDRQSVLEREDVRLYLDGSEIKRFAYRPGSGGLAFRPQKLSFGRHNVKIVVEDPQGLKAVRGWTFRVVRR